MTPKLIMASGNFLPSVLTMGPRSRKANVTLTRTGGRIASLVLRQPTGGMNRTFCFNKSLSYVVPGLAAHPIPRQVITNKIAGDFFTKLRSCLVIGDLVIGD